MPNEIANVALLGESVFAGAARGCDVGALRRAIRALVATGPTGSSPAAIGEAVLGAVALDDDESLAALLESPLATTSLCQ